MLLYTPFDTCCSLSVICIATDSVPNEHDEIDRCMIKIFRGGKGWWMGGG